MASRDPALKVLLCGACMSGNMGGPALYLGMREALRLLDVPVEITVLSKYPADDAQPCAALGWRMIEFTSLRQLTRGVPLSLVYAAARMLGVMPRRSNVDFMQAVLTHDVLIDLSGISFTDDRDVSGLVINVLWLLPALAVGLPFVKAAQAMGPFRRPLVRAVSRFVLSRAAALAARGAESAGHVRALLPHREVPQLDDLAFLMPPAQGEEVDTALHELGLSNARPYCVLAPSHAVWAMADVAQRERYVALYADIARHAEDRHGLAVLLLPHERAHGAGGADDLMVCHQVLARAPERRWAVLERHVSAPLLKALVGGAQVALGSRFHFMVAAMGSAVPAIAIGWSHKYREMMAAFAQERRAIDYRVASADTVREEFDTLYREREALRATLAAHGVRVRERALENGALALRAAGIAR
jgi:polysaccharide pyruvyl transferase WcaK-like protein